MTQNRARKQRHARSHSKFPTLVRLSLLAFVFFAGCAHKKTKVADPPQDSVKEPAPLLVQIMSGSNSHELAIWLVEPKGPPPADYQKALDLLNAGDFASAAAGFSRFVQQNPASEYTQIANWQAGRALEGLKRWKDAAQRYRSVVVATQRGAPRLQAMAFYRLSFCHEALGDDQKTTVVLLDLYERADRLPREIAQAELPARLAAAYARIGNFDKAVEYYKKAEAGIARLKRTVGISAVGVVPPWLPRTLYFMGSLSLRRVGWSDFETAFRPLGRSQLYLLEAADLQVEPWSEKAASDLNATYADLWQTLSHPPKSQAIDADVEDRRTQERQWERTQLMYDALAELKARILPTTTSSATLKIQNYAAELERQLAQLLSEAPVGSGLTPESIERKKTVRGRVISPDSTLERKFLESAKVKKNTPLEVIIDSGDEPVPERPPQGAPAKPPEGATEDPNL